MLIVYNTILLFGLVAGLPLWIPYVAFSRKRRKTFLQRLAIVPSLQILKTGLFHPQAEKSIWIHTLSVGETLAALPLIKALKNSLPQYPVFVSTSTQTGYEMALKTHHEVADALFYYPYDIPPAVNRMIRTVNPGLMLIVETDVWPNFLSALKRRRIPAIFVNAKLSDRSFRSYRWLPFFSKPLFSMFAKICAQTQEDQRRFQLLGIAPDRITVTGNIKYDQTCETIHAAEIKYWTRLLGITPSQKVVVAGSTHAGEESIIGEALAQLKADQQELFLVLAPRDPLRADDIVRQLGANGLALLPLSGLDGQPHRPLDGVVVDTLGLLRKLYAIADIAILGGSLIAIKGIGGHNPLEPAAYAKPILFGPHVNNFKEIYANFESAGGAQKVHHAADLKNTLADLLENQHRAQQMGKRAHEVFTRNQGAVAGTLERVVETLHGN